MKGRATAAIGCAIVMTATPVSAQWPVYRTPGTPQLPDGRIDMNAPAPRTSDGRPDLSGTWENLTGILGARGPKPEVVTLDKRGTVVVRRRWRELQGRTSAPAVGRGAQEAAHGCQQQGQPRRLVPADGQHAVQHPPVPAEDDPDAPAARHPLRDAHGRPALLHGRRGGGGDLLAIATAPRSGAVRIATPRTVGRMRGLLVDRSPVMRSQRPRPARHHGGDWAAGRGDARSKGSRPSVRPPCVTSGNDCWIERAVIRPRAWSREPFAALRLGKGTAGQEVRFCRSI
jgi:hypothetical protein